MSVVAESHNDSTPTNKIMLRIARRSRIGSALVNANRAYNKIVARYQNRSSESNEIAGHTPTTKPNTTSDQQVSGPCRLEGMPSQSVHLPEQLYEYIITTKDEDQSTSARVAELVSKGKEVEADGD